MKEKIVSRFSKKYLAAALIAFFAVALFAASGGIALAAPTSTQQIDITTQTPSFYSCVTSPASCLVYFVSLTINGSAALLIAIGGFLVRYALAFNGNIFNSPFVQKGFGISLSLANLGFVLGIIIIAIATILQRETYGYKKTLWRLITMAILVNFGLVIAAPIISFSDSMTSYFVSAVGGGQGAFTGAAGFSGPSGTAFVTNITAAFAPQALLAQQPTSTSSGPGVGGTIAGCYAGYVLGGLFSGSQICSALVGQVSDSVGAQFTQSLLSLIFSIIFSFIIALTYFTLAVLLFVRYVWILILLVTLPLGWLMWIFPNYNHLFSKWWSEFIKWTFFPVAATFFIYLAYIMIAPTNPGAASPSNPYLSHIGQTADTGVQGANLPDTAIALNIGAEGPVQAGLDAFALCALMIGGLMMASSLTGKFGGIVVDQAKAVSGAVQGYVGRQTKKGARLAYQKTKLPAVADRLREGRFGGLEKVPGLGWGLRRGGSLVGRGMAGVATNSKMVEDSKKSVPKNYKDIEKDLAGGGLSTQEKFAWLAELAKQGKLTEETKIGNQKAHEFFDENEFLFARYGQGKLRADGDKLFMSNQAYRDARKKGDTTAMQTAMDKFLVDFTKQDSARVNSNALFNENADQNDVAVRLHALAQRPELVPGIYKKLNGKNQQYFEENYGEILDQELGGYDAQITADQKRAIDPLKLQLENNKAQREQFNAQIQALKDKNETLKRSRTLAVGRDQESIDQDIAANEDTAKKLQDQITASNDADKSLNDQLGQISKRFIENTPARIARLKKAKTAFERLFINNATEGPSEEKEEKKEDSKKDGEKKDGGGH